MDKRTLGIIYALKQCNYSSDSTIRMFMTEYSMVDWNKFGRKSIEELLRQTCEDFICNSDFPLQEIRRYFNTYNSVFCNTEFDVQVNFLRQARVKDNEGNYINTFTDNPYSDFKVFEREED